MSLAINGLTEKNYRQSMSLNQAATRIGVSRRTLNRLIARGDIRAWRIGHRLVRLDTAEIERFLTNSRILHAPVRGSNCPE